jgi:hypothetical protein
MNEKELYRGPIPEAHVGGTINRVDVMCVRCNKPVRVEYNDEMGQNPGYCCGLEYRADWVVQLVIQETADAKRIHENRK